MQWISVKDQLPDDCNEYLVAIQSLIRNEYKVTTSSLNPAKTGFYVDYHESGDYPVEEVTHWMPLPELPQ